MDFLLDKIHTLREMIFFTKEELLKLWFSGDLFNELVQKQYIVNIYQDFFSLNSNHVKLTSLTFILLCQKIMPEIYLTKESALIYHDVYFWNIRYKFFWMNSKDKDFELKIWDFRAKFIASNKDMLEGNIENVYLDIGNKAVGEHDNITCKIASIELALIDIFSRYPYEVDENTIDAMKFEPDEMTKKINIEKLLIMANKWDENLKKNINNFINWLSSWDYWRDTIVW